MKKRSIRSLGMTSQGVICGVVCLWASVAAADSDFCNTFAPGGINASTTFAAGFYFCADATARGDTMGAVLDIDSAGPFLQRASVVGSGPGVFSAARSEASSGTLRAYASGSADAANPGDPDRIGSGIANAFFYDSGPLTSTTLTGGTPVTMDGIATISGAFVGTGASGRGYLSIFRNGFFAPGTGGGPITFFLAAGAGVANIPINLTGFNVGDTLGIFLTIQASANGVNRPPTSSSAAAIADMESTGRFFLDIKTAGVDFNAASGHIYAIPEPSTAALTFAGVALLVMLALRRQRGANRARLIKQ